MNKRTVEECWAVVYNGDMLLAVTRCSRCRVSQCSNRSCPRRALSTTEGKHHHSLYAQLERFAKIRHKHILRLDVHASSYKRLVIAHINISEQSSTAWPTG